MIERELLADYPDPEMGTFPMHHVVPRLPGTPGSIRTPAPRWASTTGRCWRNRRGRIRLRAIAGVRGGL